MLTGMNSDAIRVETQSVSAKTALQPDRLFRFSGAEVNRSRTADCATHLLRRWAIAKARPGDQAAYLGVSAAPD
jgi:hypothetical protein